VLHQRADTQAVEEEIAGQRLPEARAAVCGGQYPAAREQYIELYSNAALFAAPRCTSLLGIINLEAMACERPVCQRRGWHQKRSWCRKLPGAGSAG